MNKTQKILAILVMLFFVAVFTFLVTFFTLNRYYTQKMDELISGEVASKASELEQYIDQYFVNDPDMTAMADAVAETMVQATGDEWSFYIPASQYSSYMDQMNNSYVGVGITITAEETGGFRVQSVTVGGPAEEAGILPEDLIVGVDGTDVREMDTDGVSALVRGKEGTFVTLTVERGSESLDIAVERRTIVQVVAEGRLLEGNIGYIIINNFDALCADQTISAIESMMAMGAESLIFDVRNNPGGYKTELVKVLDYLLPEGELFRMVSSTGEESIDYSDADCLDVPMVVLANIDSYSAAEFFAAALQEYGAAEVVGSQTYGKGYYQYTYTLSDGSAVALSSGTYYTPNGVSLAGVGVTPDHLIDLSEEDYLELYYDRLEPEEDEQLQKAIELLK